MQSDGNKKVKWGLDKAHTEIGFKVKHLMVATLRGWFKDFDADIVTTGEDLLPPKWIFGLTQPR